MTLSGLLDRVEGVPIVRVLSRASHDRRFEANTNRNLFRGVFSSYAAAEASAPRTRPVGYDNPASAEMYLHRLAVEDYDYPSMFWIADAVSRGMRRIADLGGSVGIKYFAFSQHITFPTDMVWRVIDVPAVAQRGREFAASRRAARSLEFSDAPTDASGMDVLFASGALQYMPVTLAELLDTLAVKPARIVVNMTPMHESRSFFTLNSIGTAYCAYRVQRRDEFVTAVLSRGYRLRHEWINAGRRLRIPLEPEHSEAQYTGFCFDADPQR
jgi:putative methyltransferase (TIGR04325 family)